MHLLIFIMIPINAKAAARRLSKSRINTSIIIQSIMLPTTIENVFDAHSKLNAVENLLAAALFSTPPPPSKCRFFAPIFSYRRLSVNFNPDLWKLEIDLKIIEWFWNTRLFNTKAQFGSENETETNATRQYVRVSTIRVWWNDLKAAFGKCASKVSTWHRNVWIWIAT